MRRPVASTVVLALQLLSLEVARADAGASVAIVAGKRGALASRVADELRAAGLLVNVEPTTGDVVSDGVVIVIGEGEEPIVEIRSKHGSETTLVAVVGAGGSVDARVLRVAELVRALALPSGARVAAQSAEPPLAPAPLVPPAAPPPDQAAKAAGAPASTTLLPAPPGVDAGVTGPIVPPPLRPVPAPIFDAGVAAALGVAAQGASMSIQGTIRVWPHDVVGVGVLADLPVVGTSIAATEGVATMRRHQFGAELEIAPARRGDWIGLVLAPGIGFAYVTFTAEAAAGYRARDDGVFAALAYGRAEGRLRLAESVHATAGVVGGAAFPPIEVRFGGRAVSTHAATGAISLGLLLEL